MSMKDIAQQIGVSDSTYREWEYGRSIRGEQCYEKLASALRISVYELVTGKPTSFQKMAETIERIERELEELKTAIPH